MLKLSIIIPHYNRPMLLENLLLTIPEKPEIEVIVVDDRSDKYLDELAEVINKYENKNITFIVNESENKGAGASRNIGIHHSRAEWVMFADSDDFFEEDFYIAVSAYFDKEVEMIYFRVKSKNLLTGESATRDLNRNLKLANYENSKKDAELKLKYTMESSVAILYLKSLIKNNSILFDEVLSGEDKLFTSKASYFCKRFMTSPHYLYIVTQGSDNITMNKSLDIVMSVLEMDIKKMEFLKNHLSYREIRVLGLTLRHNLMDLLKYHGLIELIKTIFKLQKRGVKWFEWKFINPIFMINRIYYHYYRFHKDKNRIYK
jgi:glycosyltransferase involved in cell wall biosynthesis